MKIRILQGYGPALSLCQSSGMILAMTNRFNICRSATVSGVLQSGLHSKENSEPQLRSAERCF
jgi:hypothetical protein